MYILSLKQQINIWSHFIFLMSESATEQKNNNVYL